MQLARTFAIITLTVLTGARLSGADPRNQVDAGLVKAEKSHSELVGLVQPLRSIKAPAGVKAQHLQVVFTKLGTWTDRWGTRKLGDVEVPLYPTTTGALAGFGKGINGNWHPVDSSALKRDGAKITGDLRIQISKEPVPQWVTISLDLTVGKSGIKGTYTTTDRGSVKPGPGTIGGTVKTLTMERTPPAEPKEELMASEADNAGLRLRYLDESSAFWYRTARSHLLCQLVGVAPETAWFLSGTVKQLWPALEQIKKAKQKTKAKGGDALIDALLDDDEFDLEDDGPPPGPGKKKGKKGKSGKTQGADTARFSAFAAAASDVAERVAARVAAITAAKAALPTPQIGEVDGIDPRFGPWFGTTVLAEGNPLPPYNPSGKQDWQTVAHWTCVGPFPQRDRVLSHPTMPTEFPSWALKSTVDRRVELRSKRGPTMPKETCIGAALIEAGSGRTNMPPYVVWEDHGQQRWDGVNSTWYARTTVQSKAAEKRWLAISASDHVQLWLNGEMAWRSPVIRNLRAREQTWRVQLPFVKGANQLVCRLDNDKGTHWFRIKVCAAGSPRDAATVAREQAVIAKDLAAAGSPTAGTQGFRNDGSGHYDANPPLAWDPFKNINVRWRTKLGFSFATPVVIGDLVVTMEEPHTVVGLDRATGAVKWRTDCDIVTLRDEKLQAEAKEVREAAKLAKAKLEELGGHKNTVIAKLVEQGAAQAAAEETYGNLSRTAGGYLRFLKKAGVKEPGWYRDIGHTYSTPVTDGKHIFIKSNTGVMACVDTDGKLIWLVDHKRSVGGGCGSVSSPLLIGDKVLAFFPEPTNHKWGDQSVNVVLAFDRATGKQLYRTETPKRGDFTGGMVGLRLSNGTDRCDVVVTANGAVVGVDDGRLLVPYLGINEHYGTPISDGADQVVFGAPKNRAVFRLHLLDKQTVGVQTVWSLDSFGYGQDGNYGLVIDDKLYYAKPSIDVMSLADGQVLGTISRPFFCPRNGRGYPPVAYAGGHLYVADNATWFAPTNRPHTSQFPGALSAILPGTPGIVLARNQIRPINGGYSAHGDGLYVRSKHELTCYAVVGKEGQAYQAEHVAGEILKQVFPAKPTTGAPIAINAAIEIDKRKARRFRVGGDSGGWVCVGPFAADQVGAVAAELSKPTLIAGKGGGDTVAGAEVRQLHGGNMETWRRTDMFDLSRFSGSHYKHIGKGDITNPEVDLPKLTAATAGKQLAFGACVEMTFPGTVRVDAGHPQAKVWIGGKQVPHNALVSLPAGATAVVVSVAVDDLEGANRLLRPRLWPSAGGDEDLASWTTTVTSVKRYLEDAVKHAGSTPVGQHAKRVLGSL